MRQRIRDIGLGALVVIAVALAVTSGTAQQVSPAGSGQTVVLGAGSAKAGIVTTDQTTHGTTDLVAADHTKIGGVAISTGNGVTGTGVQRVTIASDQTAFSVNALQSGVWTVQPGNTANTTPWFVKSVPSTTCGTTAVSAAMQAVPTSATALWASTTCVMKLFFNNTNAGNQTITITDNAGSPINVIGPAFTMQGLGVITFVFDGTPFTTGLKWSAGGTGVVGGGIGYQ